MQQLHLVGFTTDLEGLIFSIRKGSKSGGYVIVLDEDLMTKIDEAQRLRNGAAGRPAAGDEPAPRTTATHTSPGRPPAPRLDKPPRPESALSPREIQSRLRSRETPQPTFCWHCQKPLQARTSKCPFCGELQR